MDGYEGGRKDECLCDFNCSSASMTVFRKKKKGQLQFACVTIEWCNIL